MSKIVDKPAGNSVEVLSFQVNKDLVDENVFQFTSVCQDLIKLYAAKNHDYGNSFEEGCRKIGSGYPLGRILDKVNRLIACMGKEDEMQVNETIEDTLKDLANYSIMTLIFMYKKTATIMAGRSVRLSKKYGLNPSLMVCPICGESVGVAILGANHGKKAPIKMNGDLCDKCKEKYVTIIEVENETNPKPTGRYIYVPKEYINVDCPENKAIMGKEEFSKTFNNNK